MPVLIVVAHPDDEVLGCGGTVASLAKQGVEIYSCILCGQVQARNFRPSDTELLNNIHATQKLLGLQEPILGPFPNIKLNSIPHLDLVQFIENIILEVRPQWIFTHHPADLNDDHYHTSRACQAASRLFQRRENIPHIKSLFYMEILSSTDWAFPGNGNQFVADTFFSINDTLQAKLDALHAYRGVMRDFPHPRSQEILTGLAALRGGQSGLKYAEAFQTAFHVMNHSEFL
ncbi:MAG: PIG-L family deacetylase [Magnetococcus sp. YQC-5]